MFCLLAINSIDFTLILFRFFIARLYSTGSQELIVNCVRDDTGKTVMPFLCSAETKPEVRIRVCNDHPCPPR